MKKTALIIMLITVLSKILGFGRDLTLSYFYGASNISDAYLVAQTVPSILTGFIGTALMTAYIPIESKIEKKHGFLEGNKYTSNLINIVILIIGVIFLFSLCFTEQIVKICASGFHGENLLIAVKFTKISLVGMFFTALLGIYTGYLQLKEDFVTPVIIGFPLNIIVILSILLSSNGNINILIIGTVLATALQLGIMLIMSYKKGFRYSFILNFKDINIKETLAISIPVIMGASVNQINVLVDRTIASKISIGGISALNYADRLNLFIQGIFVTSIISVIYPYIAKMIINNNLEGLKKTIKHSVVIVMIFVIPITIGSMFFSSQIIIMLFGRGKFDDNAVQMTSSALFFYSSGMLGFGLREVLARAFYAIKDTRTPTINATLGLILNIVLNVLLSSYMGIGGLALATSISALFTTFLLFISLRKKIGEYDLKSIIISFIKIVITSLFMGIIAYYGYQLISIKYDMIISLFCAINLGMIVYFIIILFMKIEEVEFLKNSLKSKIARRKS